jgi:hypothetical protein
VLTKEKAEVEEHEPDRKAAGKGVKSYRGNMLEDKKMPSCNKSQVPGHGEQLGGSIVPALLGSVWHLLQTAVWQRPIRMQRLSGVREAWQNSSAGGSEMVGQFLTAPFHTQIAYSA